jgi:hypothetical protein
MGHLGRRKERRLAALEELRQVRRLVTEDVTVFGEQLADLHVETMTTELDDDMRGDYQRALDLYDVAKHALTGARAAEDVAAVRAVEPVLNDGRFHLACVLARRDDVELPERRQPCFFNPQHGPAVADLSWTPPGGVERQVPVCRSDKRRLDGGDDPEIRLVRVGDRYLPWHEAQPLSPGGVFSSTAALAGGRAHISSGSGSALTDQHVAEAHMRAGHNPGNSPTGIGGGGMGI